MLIIRKCTQCGRTYDAISNDDRTICPLCAGDLSGCEEITEDNVYLKDYRSFSDEPTAADTIRTDLKKQKRNEYMKQNRVSEELSQDFFKQQIPQTTATIDIDELEAELLKSNLSQFQNSYPIIPLKQSQTPSKTQDYLRIQKIKVHKTSHNPYIDLSSD